MRSGFITGWSCILYTDEQVTSQVELESSVEDLAFQDSKNEEQVNLSIETKSSLECVPLQDTLCEDHAIGPKKLEISLEDPPLQNEELATTPVLVFFQLFEDTKHGHNKLTDSLGYTYKQNYNG